PIIIAEMIKNPKCKTIINKPVISHKKLESPFVPQNSNPYMKK
ncbi:MAG: hypothetical protein ACI8Q1_003681, partial [Parvicella sp.]